jgi:3-oxoacyl-[acyl-carrier-protein] synthase-3
MTHAAVTGWGTAVPERVVTNAEIAEDLPFDEAWIVERTGIVQRHVAGPHESTSSLATAAGRRALARAGVDPEDLDLVVVATCTPDRPIPATAPLVQAALGARGAGAFDVGGACAGFLHAVAAADGLIRAGRAGRVLVAGAEVMSRMIAGSAAKTRILFGDGAGAVVLERAERPAGLLSLELGADGTAAGLIEVPAGGVVRPASAETVARGEHWLYMNGPEVFRAAVRVMAEAATRALVSARLSVDDVDLLVLHQANQRIIDDVARRLGVPGDRVFSNVARYGNVSAASVPLALAEAADEGRLHPGSRILVSAIGAGVTWAAAVVEWSAARVPGAVPAVTGAVPAGAAR